MRLQQSKSGKLKPFKPELNKVLAELVKYIPKGRCNITIDSNVDEETKEKSYNIYLPPSMFMFNYPANNPNLKIEKREFWNSECHENLASLEIRKDPSIKIWATLIDTLPREYKYLSERR